MGTYQFSLVLRRAEGESLMHIPSPLTRVLTDNLIWSIKPREQLVGREMPFELHCRGISALSLAEPEEYDTE